MIMGYLNTFSKVESLQSFLSDHHGDSKLGFIPTMGALHEGHLSLVRKGESLTDVVVVSIFVNPTQFSDSSDLEAYPRTLEKDIELLSEFENVVVFHPNKEEIYPKGFIGKKLDLGSLAMVMEGAHRDGHFDGVVEVVHRLFEIVRPKCAFFGEKDFQQLAVIRHMVRSFEMDIEIVACPTSREESGLARSSRNERLNSDQLEEATILSHALNFVASISDSKTVAQAKQEAIEMINTSNLELEYFELVDPDSLQPLNDWVEGTRACLAAFCGEVRLIDNLEVFSLKENSVPLS